MKSRTHLEAMPPYTPIEPFEILSARGLDASPPRSSSWMQTKTHMDPYRLSARHWAGWISPIFIPTRKVVHCRKSLSVFTGIGDEYLLAGAGADELIDLLMRVLLDPGDCILSCPPTFGMYSFDAELNAAHCIEIPRSADFSLEMESIRKAVETYQPKILFVASPNNPDGSLLE